MATKDYCLNDVNEDIVGNINNPNGQYSNLNLNQNYKCSNISSSLDSKVVTNSSKNDQGYGFNGLHDLHSEKCSWKKSNNKILSKNLLNNDSSGERKLPQMNNDNGTIKNSTLSLHIAAYENSIEAKSDSLDVEASPSSKIKTSKKQLVSSSKIIQNSFEFPRQRENEAADGKPEIMQFKASQKLLNPSNDVTSPNQLSETEQKLLHNINTMDSFQSEVINIVNTKPLNLALPFRKYIMPLFKGAKLEPALLHNRIVQMICEISAIKEKPVVLKYYDELIFNILYCADDYLKNQKEVYIQSFSSIKFISEKMTIDALKILIKLNPINHIFIIKSVFQLETEKMSILLQKYLRSLIPSKPERVTEWIHCINLSEFLLQIFPDLVTSSLLLKHDLKTLFNDNAYYGQKLIECMDLVCSSENFDQTFGDNLSKNSVVKKMFKLAIDLHLDPAALCPFSVRRRRIQNLLYNLRCRPNEEIFELATDLMEDFGELDKIEKFDVIGALIKIEQHFQYVGIGLGKIYGLSEKELWRVNKDYKQRLQWDLHNIEAKVKTLKSGLLREQYIDRFYISTECQVILIDDAGKIDAVISKLEECKTVAIDVEASQVFQEADSVAKATVLQLAFKDVVFVVDLLPLSQNDNDELLKVLFEKLFDNEVLKIGFDSTSDINFLRRTFDWMSSVIAKTLPEFRDTQDFVKMVSKNYLYKQHFPQLEGSSLSEVVEKWLDVSLPKKYQSCNWKKRPLSKPKLEYASRDAMYTLKLYWFIQEETEKLGTSKNQKPPDMPEDH